MPDRRLASDGPANAPRWAVAAYRNHHPPRPLEPRPSNPKNVLIRPATKARVRDTKPRKNPPMPPVWPLPVVAPLELLVPPVLEPLDPLDEVCPLLPLDP
ncbi:MAG: hypothetical protein QOK10_75, partial [Pseudonocardiales bacterium]|nr:hypothetical protein [Pseudonocardiales bacterium]